MQTTFPKCQGKLFADFKKARTYFLDDDLPFCEEEPRPFFD